MSKDLVWGMGPEPCLAMIVGEAPGEAEEILGAPFVGRSGLTLDQALREAGASRDEFYITNVYKLRPPENRPPTDDELNKHLKYLLMEFDAVEPKFILLLGGTATREFMGEEFENITAHRGKWQDGEKGEVYLATFHPSAARFKDKRPYFFDDVAKFVEAVRTYESTEHSA